MTTRNSTTRSEIMAKKRTKKGIGKKVHSGCAGHMSPGHKRSTQKAAKSKKFYR